MKPVFRNSLFLLLIGMLIFSNPAAAQKKILVSANKRFFTDEKGQPFFLLGDTGWLLFSKLDRRNAEKYLEDRRQKGYNVIQAMVLHTVQAKNVYGDSALINKNVAKPNIKPGTLFLRPSQYDYWDHVDYIIDLAAKKRIVHGVSSYLGNQCKKWMGESR